MIKFSIILGILGLLGTAAAMPYLGRWVSNWGLRQHWLVGLTALFPAWLIAFLGLLPSSVGPEYDPLPRSALLSSVVALLGVVDGRIAAGLRTLLLETNGCILLISSYSLLRNLCHIR